MSKNRNAQREPSPRLVVLVIAGALGLGYPAALSGGMDFIAGIPALYLYLFCVWAVFIVLTALVMRTVAIREDEAASGAGQGGNPDA